MTDRLSPEQRSWNMSRIRGKDTGPERAVRSLLHRLGYRFRLHSRVLPGKPDIVLRRYRTVIFVHGCFWHRHRNCRFAYSPKTRQAFWAAKFRDNQRRDARLQEGLKSAGWRVLIVWECELRKEARLRKRLESHLLRHDSQKRDG
jgi:DNA mismatch endonuclease (patch repair protein)